MSISETISSKLKDLYYDPETGYTSAIRLFQLAKERGLSIKLKDVQDFVSKQQVSQLHAQPRKEKNFLHIVSPALDGVWQADLIDLPKVAKANNGYRYILTIVDVYSRYAFCITLKKKNGKAVAEAFKELFKKGRIPKKLTTDAGSEFLNPEMRALLKKNNVEHLSAQAGDHNRLGIIERFNRTLKTYLARFFTATNQKSYVNSLPLFVKNYNNQVHSTIDRKPITVKDGDISDSLEQDNNALDQFYSFQIGDVVRVQLERNVFSKGYIPRYSKETYVVGGIIGYAFELYSLQGELQKKLYKASQLLKISDIQKTPQGVKEIANLRGADLVFGTEKRTVIPNRRYVQ